MIPTDCSLSFRFVPSSSSFRLSAISFSESFFQGPSSMRCFHFLFFEFVTLPFFLFLVNSLSSFHVTCEEICSSEEAGFCSILMTCVYLYPSASCPFFSSLAWCLFSSLAKSAVSAVFTVYLATPDAP